jgi:hypothetical protein
MLNRSMPSSSLWFSGLLALGAAAGIIMWASTGTAQKPADSKTDFATIQPLLTKYCLGCHSTKLKRGSLDLERFQSLDDIRKDLKPWQGLIEQIEAGEMPPKEKPQPTAEEKKQLVAWVRGFLDSEAKARAGDPGHVPLRRLSNAEYNYTIRDLTGVDLQPTREFPADGAAGEGFTNAAEALTDISPALFTKYLNAAKDIAEHAVLVPDGFRFSLTKTRRDWTDESLGRLRALFAEFVGPDGKLPVQAYLAATVRHRDALTSGKITLDEVAAKEKLNRKYLGILWQALTDKTASYPLDAIRTRWRAAKEKDVPALTAEVIAWQTALWKFTAIGSYRNTHRQVANDPPAVETQQVRVLVKPTPGQSDVGLYLTARDSSPGAKGHVIWSRPRLESTGKPTLLLADYAKFGPAFEVDYPSVFANTAKYLAAVVEAANSKKLTIEELAKKHELDAPFLKKWIEILAVEPFAKDTDPEKIGRIVPAVALELLEEKTSPNNKFPGINGWHKKGTDLPVLVTNTADKAEQIPGRISARGVAVHPLPKEFVAVVWKSPLAGTVRITAKIVHAHPTCGNGVAWWLEHRRGNRAVVVGEGAIDLGGEAQPAKTLKLEKGDVIILAVDAKEENHQCDLTDISFTLTEVEKPGREWDLAKDIVSNVLDGNPHGDTQGNKDTWSFVRGPTRPLGKGVSYIIPATSVLGKWRDLASDAKKQAEAEKLAERVQELLSGTRPPQEQSADRVLYDKLVSGESVLFQGIDPGRLGKPRTKDKTYGLAKGLFGKHPDGKTVDAASFVGDVNTLTELRLPAALLVGREFVVDGKLDAAANDRLVQFQVLTSPPAPDAKLDTKSSIVTSPRGEAYKRLLGGYAEFRNVFPVFVCYPRIRPADEDVCLKMFHREDDELSRLFLTDEQKKTLDHLWTEHRFITRFPIAENNYLPQFIGFVTQDQPKELVTFFENKRPEFQKRADELLHDEEAAIPKQLDVLLEFATRAYRRPLQENEKVELLALYKTIRAKGAPPDEAFRGVLARVLVSPAFLFRIEQAHPGKEPEAVNDWELATRLSYFLWSSVPDEELRKLAATGQLRDPKVLSAQVTRMLKDDRLRALAIEFGTQWIHARGFDELKEKNEKLFPTFDAKLRKAIYEESILFFQDLFQSDREVTKILDADYTFLNDTLAQHYGIPGVFGQQWRRVDGVRKYGRGGILGMASVQTKQAGASRTSPVLRGNWVVETLLGEKLPKPPPNVPQLPEIEGADKLTMRQLVEKHASVQSCAVCHVRIDPFGFALENYDPIGRWRDKDLGGLAVDAKAKLKDGTEFDGIDGLRNYLLTKKKDVIVRLFCRRLLGYALGRGVTLSDTVLLDEMVSALNKNNGKSSAAVQVIVKSPQFRMVRGSDFGE